ncbi:CBS domain-containing protein [Burkholderia vietnamiensis]|uniref:CBS domain-containing protein n=1 Tax=Burkholderia vietnamiensis TaxID=60552 RepID=UPI001125E3B8|nr:CBS domain-containing protein [Burkholderia vietnamiensis]TPQ48556.1 CBS domain-containing protein [Burkholderia ubonensis]MBR8036415.1 CBS domain-containing protein [Burkholderia vietnamiensis]MCA8267659.1 CBS domain-containing protein [Burkholderia vietnamiensis]UKV74057.1 CBS domain-containing protein [Burkholderia vietnamiensis]CAG9221807.1 Putative signal-transduction protein with CBS domains [Burkholderia vietnamiensis]
MNAAMLCTRDVATCTTQATVVDAAAMMRDAHAGDLVVVSEQDGKLVPVGMVTDRDIVLTVVRADAAPGALFVGDVMSAPVALANAADDIWLLAKRMRQHGVRRLPVVGADGELVGVVSLDDMLRAAAALLDELRLVAARQVYFEEKQRG